MISRLMRAAGTALLKRADKTPSDYGPFHPKTDNMWSMVRGNEPVQHTREGRNVRIMGLEGHAVAAACIRTAVDQLASVPLEAYRTTKTGDIDTVPTSPLQQFLDRPAPQVSGFAFRRTMGSQLFVYGNSYHVMLRDGRGQVERIMRLHPERLQQIIIDGETGEISFYVWNDHSGRQRVSPWTDVIHVKDMETDPDGWFGYPRMATALQSMATDTEASTYVRQVVTNSGVPALVLLARAGIAIEDLKKAEEAWHERMVGRGERGRTRFLGAIEKLEVIGHTLTELEFPALRAVNREDICAAAGVDPRLVNATSAKGSEGGMSGQQYQEARRKLEQITCAPYRMAIADALDISLTPEFGEVYARFSPDAIGQLIETQKETADRVSVLVEKGIWTIEEGRAATGKPEELDEAHHTTAGSLRTVGKAIELSEAPPEPKVLPGAAGATKPADRAMQQAPNARQLTSGASPSRFLQRGMVLTAEQRTALWRAFDARATADEAAYRDSAAALFATEAQIVHRLIVETGERSVRADGVSDAWVARVIRALEELFGAQFVDAWSRAFQPHITLTLTGAAQQLANELGVSFDLANPRVTSAIAGRVNKLAGNVAQTTLDKLRVIVAAGRAAGQGPEAIANVITSAVYDPAITEQRALVIAETETVGALNEGEWLAAIESGVMQSKSQLVQADGKARESHVACGEQGWIPIDQPYTNGLMYPHDPNGPAAEVVRCRCSQLFSDLSPEEAGSA